MNLPRRLFLASAAALAAQPKTLPAGEILARIRKGVAVPWREQTVDTLKWGTPETPVTGIATTFMSTFEVLQKAAAQGKNMVITHEPTFFAHDDSTRDTAEDAVVKAKQAFLTANNMVIFRFHDHWHARRPDGIRVGMLAELGWDRFAKPGSRILERPEISLSALAEECRQRLRIRAIRVLGDPRLAVKKVALSPGYSSFPGAVRALAEADVLVIGEAREWEVYEYVQDAITAGQAKALIVLGHAVSEEGGMAECARWVGGLVPELPVGHVPAGEPFWSL